MTPSLALDSRDLARELYTLLREIDPARWRDHKCATVRSQVSGLRARLDDLLDHTDSGWGHPHLLALRARLRFLSTEIEALLPDAALPVDRMRVAWNDFRVALQPSYESLAAALEAFDLRLPSLRPTNYTRSIFHVSSGLLAVTLLNTVIDGQTAVWVGAGLATLAWSAEAGRRVSRRINNVMMWIFGRVAHPHEAWKVNSATWFSTALLGLALLHRPLVASAALAVLAVGDPAAALIGRRWGRTKLVNGRSLEGTLTFVGVGALAVSLVLAIWYAHVGAGAIALVAFGAAVPAAIAELFSSRIDDNLSIPVTAALGALLTAMALGL